jgi:hypothetical protein
MADPSLRPPAVQWSEVKCPSSHALTWPGLTVGTDRHNRHYRLWIWCRCRTFCTGCLISSRTVSVDRKPCSTLQAHGHVCEMCVLAWLISPYSNWKWAKWPSGDVGWLPTDIELPATCRQRRAMTHSENTEPNDSSGVRDMVRERDAIRYRRQICGERSGPTTEQPEQDSDPVTP